MDILGAMRNEYNKQVIPVDILGARLLLGKRRTDRYIYNES